MKFQEITDAWSKLDFFNEKRIKTRIKGVPGKYKISEIDTEMGDRLWASYIGNTVCPMCEHHISWHVKQFCYSLNNMNSEHAAFEIQCAGIYCRECITEKTFFDGVYCWYGADDPRFLERNENETNFVYMNPEHQKPIKDYGIVRNFWQKKLVYTPDFCEHIPFIYAWEDFPKTDRTRQKTVKPKLNPNMEGPLFTLTEEEARIFGVPFQKG